MHKFFYKTYNDNLYDIYPVKNYINCVTLNLNFYSNNDILIIKF